MTRILRTSVLVMALVAATLLIAACGDSGDDGGGGGGDSIKVGLVTDTGGLNDRSFNKLANDGLERAKDELDVEGSVLESKAASDYNSNLGKFASQDYDLTVGVGFLMADSIKATAAKVPDAKFAIIDFSYGDAPIKNVRGLLFKEQEAGYLAGALAGMAEEEGKLEGLNDAKVVSAVGGQKIPPVDKFIAGYRAGVMAHCKGCKVLIAYSQDFTAQDKCKEQALAQIAQGSDIVFQVAGGCGLGALDAAKSRGVWGIGVDADQGYLGDHILTSALKRVDVAVYETIKSVDDGTFKGGEDQVFSLADDGVGLGEVAEEADEMYRDRIDEVIEQIKDGKIEIPETV